MDYAQIGHQLLQGLLGDTSLQRLADLAEDILGNPIALFDAFLNEHVHSKGYPEEDPNDKWNTQSNLSQQEYLNFMRRVNSYILQGTPHILGWTDIQREHMFCGCLVSGKLKGGLQLPFVHKPLNEIDTDAVTLIAGVFGLAMNTHGWPDYSELSMQGLLWGLVTGKFDYHQLKQGMLLILHESVDSFYMIWTETEDAELFSRTIPADVNRYWQIPHKNGFAALVDTAQIDEYRAAFTQNIINAHCLLGISDKAYQLADVNMALTQARRAYYYAYITGRQEGLAIYADYQLHHFLANALGNNIPMPPNKLETIKRFDCKNESCYFETLRAYVYCNQNVAGVAKRLNIHRNTVFYRLIRIRELFEIELQDLSTFVFYYSIVVTHDLNQIPHELTEVLID